MTKKSPKNIAVSVRARLLNLAKERKEDFQHVLTRYANERLLYRLASSSHSDSFVLKGATLFAVWTGEPHRATKDVDLLGFGEASTQRIEAILRDVIELDVQDDGLVFDGTSLQLGPIREDLAYGGIRAVLTTYLGNARIRLQVDVGFGDAITPIAQETEVPSMLGFPAARLRAYPRETVVAEKLEAMVQLGILNSRMKDFYDLMILARDFEFTGELLTAAVRATFERRQTDIPEGAPIALQAGFTEERDKLIQWKAFIRKSGASNAPALEEVIAELQAFLLPVLKAARVEDTFNKQWLDGGPWE